MSRIQTDRERSKKTEKKARKSRKEGSKRSGKKVRKVRQESLKKTEKLGKGREKGSLGSPIFLGLVAHLWFRGCIRYVVSLFLQNKRFKKKQKSRKKSTKSRKKNQEKGLKKVPKSSKIVGPTFFRQNLWVTLGRN